MATGARPSIRRCGSDCAPTAPRWSAACCCVRSATCCTGCRPTASTMRSWTCLPKRPARQSWRRRLDRTCPHPDPPPRTARGEDARMRVIRAFVGMPLAIGARVALPEAAAAHLVRVLRLREGDDCVLFNGDGRDYAARIAASDKRATRVDIVSASGVGNESPLRIVLLQGIARGEKMDLILQKATELGVARVVPVDAERTEVQLDGERLRK